MPTTVTVDLSTRSYDILIAAGLLARVGALCRERGLGRTCLLVTDSNVDALHGEVCRGSLREAGIAVSTVAVPAGEESKSVGELGRIYDAGIAGGLDRSSFLVALGGGVVGDLAGYAAATYLRGIDFVQVPTSLVAAVDSAVGGKTGINLPQGKNLVGSFHQPRLVVIDPTALLTLPRREFVSGIAEVIKYGVIRDADFFRELESRLGELLAAETAMLELVIERSCAIKAEVVSMDERESGLRAILNFGHTLGHALEKVSGYGRYLHGEAISIGMVYAGRLSERWQGFPPGDQQRLVSLLSRAGLPVEFPPEPWEGLREAMAVDKKSLGRRPKLVLARRLGEVMTGCEVPEDTLKEVWYGRGK